MQSDIDKQRLEYMREPLFRQQMPMLIREYGLDEGGDDIDVRLWQESERAFSYLSRLGVYAAPMVNAFFSNISHEHGARFATLVMALVFIRTMNIADRPVADGEDFPHSDLLDELMKIGQKCGKGFSNLIENVAFNNTDREGHPVSYDHYDPIARAADAPQEEPVAENDITGLVMEATAGWNAKGIFAPHWAEWQALWKHLAESENFSERLMQKAPRSNMNHTQINMQMVCNVCHLFKDKAGCRLADTDLAKAIASAWSGESPRGYIGNKNTKLTQKEIKAINDWLAKNIS